jgi:hypothetical protein
MAHLPALRLLAARESGVVQQGATLLSSSLPPARHPLPPQARRRAIVMRVQGMLEGPACVRELLTAAEQRSVAAAERSAQPAAPAGSAAAAGMSEIQRRLVEAEQRRDYARMTGHPV